MGLRLRAQIPIPLRFDPITAFYKEEESKEIRKPIKDLTLKQLRSRLDGVSQHINFVAEYEQVTTKTIAAYLLQ